MTFGYEFQKNYPSKTGKKFQKDASLTGFQQLQFHHAFPHAPCKASGLRPFAKFSTKKLSPYPCGQGEQVHLARFVQNQIACLINFFQCLEHQYPINLCHIIFTLKLKANFLTGPVSNPNYKTKYTQLKLGISTKLQPNYFNSNVTIFSNFGFMSSFLRRDFLTWS